MFSPPESPAWGTRAELAAQVRTDAGTRLQPGIGINDAHFAAMSLNYRGLRFSPHSVLPFRLGTPCGIKDDFRFTLAPGSTRTHSVFSVAVRRYQTSWTSFHAASGTNAGKNPSRSSADCKKPLN